MTEQRSEVVQKLAYRVYLTQHFPVRISAHIPYRDVNSMGEPFFLTLQSETNEGVAKDKDFAQTGNQTRRAWSEAIVSPLLVM